MSFKFSEKSKKRMEGVNPILVEVMLKAIEVSPIDFGIPRDGGLRTTERQQELYALGRTVHARKVTNADGIRNKSYHQSGNAIDVYAYVAKKASWKKVHMGIIAGVIIATGRLMGVEIEWGGTFGSKTFQGWDSAHFQLKKNR